MALIYEQSFFVVLEQGVGGLRDDGLKGRTHGAKSSSATRVLYDTVPAQLSKDETYKTTIRSIWYDPRYGLLMGCQA